MCRTHTIQQPNEHWLLLDAIQFYDAGLQAAMASAETDNDPNGRRNNFEEACPSVAL